MPALSNLDFVDDSNILDFFSYKTSDYVPQLYLMNTIQFKHISAEFRKQSRSQELHKKIYNKNAACLLPDYISNPNYYPSLIRNY